MQHLFKHLGRRMGKGLGWHRRTRQHHGPCDNLAGVKTDCTAVIVCNNDHRTVERGLSTGVEVRVLRNEEDEPNMVVAVGDARYVLDRRVAGRITVKVD